MQLCVNALPSASKSADEANTGGRKDYRRVRVRAWGTCGFTILVPLQSPAPPRPAHQDRADPRFTQPVFWRLAPVGYVHLPTPPRPRAVGRM